jgi:hypothetical protein
VLALSVRIARAVPRAGTQPQWVDLTSRVKSRARHCQARGGDSDRTSKVVFGALLLACTMVGAVIARLSALSGSPIPALILFALSAAIGWVHRDQLLTPFVRRPWRGILWTCLAFSSSLLPCPE